MSKFLRKPMYNGLFIGILTLDLIYQIPYFPQINQKLTALDYRLAAGGPATNASVLYQRVIQPEMTHGQGLQKP